MVNCMWQWPSPTIQLLLQVGEINRISIYLYLINKSYYLLIWLWRMRGKGRGGCLKERGSSLYDGGGGWASRCLTISLKILKLIWKYFHLVLESYGKTLMMSWQKYINVCFDKNYMYVVDNNTRNIYNSAHHWPGKAGSSATYETNLTQPRLIILLEWSTKSNYLGK